MSENVSEVGPAEFSNGSELKNSPPEESKELNLWEGNGSTCANGSTCEKGSFVNGEGHIFAEFDAFESNGSKLSPNELTLRAPE